LVCSVDSLSDMHYLDNVFGCATRVFCFENKRVVHMEWKKHEQLFSLGVSIDVFVCFSLHASLLECLETLEAF